MSLHFFGSDREAEKRWCFVSFEKMNTSSRVTTFLVQGGRGVGEGGQHANKRTKNDLKEQNEGVPSTFFFFLSHIMSRVLVEVWHVVSYPALSH